MQFKKKVIYSALISAGFLAASIVLQITPCRIAPAVPNPVYTWKLCTLNPDQVSTLNSLKEFFGYTSSITDAYIITIIISFVVALVVLHLFTSKKNKN